MKKLFIALGILFILVNTSWAQLAVVDIVYEVRPTNGDNTFGGCFSAAQAVASGGTGTDQTQSNSALQTWTNLTTSGAGSTTLTDGSSGGLFTAAMQGNCIRINSGTNFGVGFYLIMSITDSNHVVLDRTPTSGGAGASGAGKVGGATKSFNGQTTRTLINDTMSGNKIYVKNEAWNEAVSLTTTCGASSNPSCQVIGYNTSRGDNPTGSSRPTNDKANSGTPFTISGNAWNIQNIIGKGAGAGSFNFNSSTSYFSCFNCRATGSANIGIRIDQYGLIANSEIDSNTNAGVQFGNSPGTIYGSIVHGNGSGIDVNGKLGINIISNLIYANTGNGIANISSGPSPINIILNTIHGNTGASTDGVGCSSGMEPAVFVDNSITSNGRDGVRCATGNRLIGMIDYNNYNGNSGTARTNFTTGSHDIAVSPSYTASGSGNFLPLTSSGLVNKGYPGAYPTSATTGKIDIGGAQSGAGGISQSTSACPQ